jgi:hypothetical protein
MLSLIFLQGGHSKKKCKKFPEIFFWNPRKRVLKKYIGKGLKIYGGF